MWSISFAITTYLIAKLNLRLEHLIEIFFYFIHIFDKVSEFLMFHFNQIVILII